MYFYWLTPFRWLISLLNFTFLEDAQDEEGPRCVSYTINLPFLHLFKSLLTFCQAIPSQTKWSTTSHWLKCGFFTMKFSRSFRKNSLSCFLSRTFKLFYIILKSPLYTHKLLGLKFQIRFLILYLRIIKNESTNRNNQVLYKIKKFCDTYKTKSR